MWLSLLSSSVLVDVAFFSIPMFTNTEIVPQHWNEGMTTYGFPYFQKLGKKSRSSPYLIKGFQNSLHIHINPSQYLDSLTNILRIEFSTPCYR